MTFFVFVFAQRQLNKTRVGGNNNEGGLKIKALTVLRIWTECTGRKSYMFNDVFVSIHAPCDSLGATS